MDFVVGGKTFFVNMKKMPGGKKASSHNTWFSGLMLMGTSEDVLIL
jgi:hypothetical protein